MPTKIDTIHNLFIQKDRVVKDGAIDYELLMYFSQIMKYDTYRIVSVSIANYDAQHFIIVAALEDIVTL